MLEFVGEAEKISLNSCDSADPMASLSVPELKDCFLFKTAHALSLDDWWTASRCFVGAPFHDFLEFRIKAHGAEYFF